MKYVFSKMLFIPTKTFPPALSHFHLHQSGPTSPSIYLSLHPSAHLLSLHLFFKSTLISLHHEDLNSSSPHPSTLHPYISPIIHLSKPSFISPCVHPSIRPFHPPPILLDTSSSLKLVLLSTFSLIYPFYISSLLYISPCPIHPSISTPSISPWSSLPPSLRSHPQSLQRRWTGIISANF